MKSIIKFLEELRKDNTWVIALVCILAVVYGAPGWKSIWDTIGVNAVQNNEIKMRQELFDEELDRLRKDFIIQNKRRSGEIGKARY